MVVTELDFEQLSVSSMDLNQDPAGPIWARQFGRFESHEDYPNPPSKAWAWAHWIEEGWGSVMLARQFLIDNGHDFEIFYDTSYPTDIGGWVIFTDYHKER